MEYFCDECLAKYVTSGKIRPTYQIWGANQEPFKHNYPCDSCGCVTIGTAHPEMESFLAKNR